MKQFESRALSRHLTLLFCFCMATCSLHGAIRELKPFETTVYASSEYSRGHPARNVVNNKGMVGQFHDSLPACSWRSLATGEGTLELMRMHRWGEVIPSCATRVEFRLRRQALTQRGIGSVEELFEKGGDLLLNLTTTWLRFTDGPVDRGHNNQQRAGTLPLWLDVQRWFIDGLGGLSGKPLAPLPGAAGDVSILAKQAVGVVLRAAREERRDLPDLRAFMDYAGELMEPHAVSRLPQVFRE